ncbi:MAG: hypothetical protein ACOCUI_05580 [bacterium]
MFFLKIILYLIVVLFLFSILSMTLFINIPLTIFFHKLGAIKVTFSYILIILVSPLFIFFTSTYLMFSYFDIQLTISTIIPLVLGLLIFLDTAFKNKKSKIQNFARHQQTNFYSNDFVSDLISSKFDKTIEKFKEFEDKAAEVAAITLFHDNMGKQLESIINEMDNGK